MSASGWSGMHYKPGVIILSQWSVVASGLGLLVGMLLGAWLWAWLLDRRKAASKLALPLPGLWPLKRRPIFNSHEQEVWQSLRSIFHDHAVMVKIPILRFTQLREPKVSSLQATAGAADNGRLNSEQWLEMLGGLYTTFTVCTMDGKVVGCMDVIGKPEGSKARCALKETLLLDCGIPYAVASAFKVPDALVLRELFLGELAAAPVDHLATRGGDSEFHADMAAFTRNHGKMAR